MTDIIAAKKKKAEELEAGNERSYAEIQRHTHGQFSMDTSDARLQMLIEFLTETGIMSEEQRADFEIAFHEKVEEALNEAWQKIREIEARRKQPRLVVPDSARQKPTLVDGNGRPLGG